MNKSAEFKSCEHILERYMYESTIDILLNGLEPCVCIIQVGDDPASNAYVRGKINDCKRCKIKTVHWNFNSDITQDVLSLKVLQANHDPRITGIIVMQPLPKHIDVEAVLSCISPEKDVDGFLHNSPFTPCTPLGILMFCEANDISLAGKHCVIVNRSKIVGLPLADALIKNHATVTVCHSHTENLAEITRLADILVVAVGKENFITQDMVKDSAIIFDVGINRNAKGKMCGDVAKDVECYYKTPVPKGVGLLTRTALVRNIYTSSLMQKG